MMVHPPMRLVSRFSVGIPVYCLSPNRPICKGAGFLLSEYSLFIDKTPNKGNDSTFPRYFSTPGYLVHVHQGVVVHWFVDLEFKPLQRFL